MRDAGRTPTRPDEHSGRWALRSRSMFVSEVGCIIVVVTACVFVSYAQWGRIPRLTDQDWGRWLFEASRCAAGETPYRDFMWPYPPLSIYLFGLAFYLYGSSFGVANALLCLTGTSVAVALYLVAREIYGRQAGLALALALVFLAANGHYEFSLFSLDMYTPAISPGCLGVVLCALALARASRQALSDRMTLAVLYSGFAVAALSKPEAALGSIVLLAATVLALGRQQLGTSVAIRSLRAVGLAAGAVVVPCAVYGVLASRTGWTRLAAGVTGYSAGTGFCPWWPTGQGLTVALAAAGAGYALGGLLALGLQLVPARRRVFAVGSVIVGIAVWTSCPLTSLIPIADTWWDVTTAAFGFFVSVQGIMLPLLWGGITVAPRLGQRCLRKWLHTRTGASRDFELLALLTASVAISSRGLFSYLLHGTPMVAPSAFPIVIIAAPAIGARLVGAVTRSAIGARAIHRITVIVVIVVLSVGVVRLVSAVVKGVRTPTDRIETAAGTVYVRDDGRSSLLLDAVRRNLGDGQSLMEIPHGGGINFSFQLPSPTYSTQFWGFRPDENILQEDLARVQQNPPALVVARDAPHFGAVYGVPGRFGCCFPEVRWVSDVATWSDREFPVVTHIERSYVRIEKVGDFVLLGPAR